MKNKIIKFIDLFAGLGGIRIGFQQAANNCGYKTECVFSSEIKEYAIKTYKKYFNEETIYGDITKIKSEDIPDFDFLLAGFPCQPFSSAGKGLGFSDTRGTMFFQIERILKDKKPFGFLLENVDGLVNHDNGNTFSIIISHLRDLGYNVSWKILNSKDFGLAQSRKRIYIVGTKDREILLNDFKTSSAKLRDVLEKNLPTVDNEFTRCLFENYTVNEIIGKSIKDKRGGKNNIHSWDIGLKGIVTDDEKELLNILLKERRKKKWAKEIGITWMDGMPLTIEQIKTFYNKINLEEILSSLISKGYLRLEHPKELVNGKRVYDENKPKGYNIVSGKLSFEFSEILNPNEVAPTLVATDISKLGVVDCGGLRRLTIREICRLFGFPDDYDLSGIKEHEAVDLLGNTVCIPVIKAISEKIIKNMPCI